jgi:ribonuclease HI
MVEILTDSAYVANCFNQRWWRSWNRRGWKSAQGKTIKNQDLWRPMIDLYLERGNITFTHVRGHQGVYWNEMADLLAHRAATLQSNGRADEMIPPGEFLSRLSKPSRQRLLAKIRADVLSQ